MSSRGRRLAALALTAALAPAAAAAQQDDPALPPRLEAGAAEDLAAPPRVGAQAPSRSSERPGAARLADPPERTSGAVEEVVVVGEQRWRLPDLGSEWQREHEAAERDAARIRTDFFVPYDPDDPTNRVDPFPINSEMRRVGYIEVFRIRFGRR